jgi:hypothetical protein
MNNMKSDMNHHPTGAELEKLLLLACVRIVNELVHQPVPRTG